MLHRTLFAATLLLLLAAQPLLACQTPSSATVYHGGNQEDFNDWGAIAMDADAGGWPQDCSKLAATTLLAKLKDMKRLEAGSYFQQPLAGYSLALILAAGQRIAAHSWFNQAVDSNPAPGVDDTLSELFDWIIWEYDPTPSNGFPGCGTGFQSNSCMDDHAGRAAAHAWIAAYKSKRGDADTSTYINAAKGNIDDFFANVCIHNPNTFTQGSSNFCNSNWTELGSGGKVIAFEHEIESPHYGFGLMTSIVQATVGLQAAGSDYNISSSENIAKAKGMMSEVQEHADSGSGYAWKPTDCLDPAPNGSGGWITNGPKTNCADQGYDPRMYHLSQYYQDKVGSTPSGSYQSDDTCCNTNGSESFWHLSDTTHFFGTGRFATYHDQAWTWYSHRNDANRYMPGDAYTPIGYVDSVGSNGLIQGWACDPDAPNGWVKVDVYVNGVKVADDPNLNDQQAWWSSEQAVNNLCLGGSAHRFSFYLPSAPAGTNVTAYARDYTFGAAGQLTCIDCTY